MGDAARFEQSDAGRRTYARPQRETIGAVETPTGPAAGPGPSAGATEGLPATGGSVPEVVALAAAAAGRRRAGRATMVTAVDESYDR